MSFSAEGTGGRRGFGTLLRPSSVGHGGAVAETTDDFRSHMDQPLCYTGNIRLTRTVPISMSYIMEWYHRIQYRDLDL